MIHTYLQEIHRLLTQVEATQTTAIDAAAQAVADRLIRGGTVFAFGTGHSHMLAEELFYRAGGLVKVYPIFDEPLMLHRSASRSSLEERREGYAAKLLNDSLPIQEGDVLFLFSNSGRNAVPVEMALEAKKRGMKTVCITNRSHSSSVSSRHPSGKRLFELCDVVIDNCGCIGDAAINVDGIPCSPTSTAVGTAILQAIVCSAVKKIREAGHRPEVFSSSNVDGGDEINEAYLNTYRPLIPML